MTNLLSKAGLRIAMSLVVLLSVTAASAESVGRFHIPFQFLMGDKVLPSGDYTVKIDTANKSIELASWQGVARVYLTADAPYRAGAAEDTGKLVFHKYGKILVLREMWRSGARYGHELTTSQAEREIARQGSAYSTTEIASVGTR